MNTAEAQAGMLRVLSEERVGSSCLLADGIRQDPIEDEEFFRQE
jgi:hypothetical protein